MENLDYNTSRKKLVMPEYGRNVLKMIEDLKKVEDRNKRNEQARAIVKVMESLNPQVHSQEDYEHKLWDHLFIIAGFDLDIDSPFPCPVAAEFSTRPVPLPMKDSRIKATHYGRNIEKVIDLVAGEPDGEIKNSLIRSLAIYMRQQYLIWNKDSVADETIFKDIERISDGRLTVPEGISLSKISENANFSRPTLGLGGGGQKNGHNNKHRQNWNKLNKKKNNQ